MFEFDIKGLFDNIDHGLLMKAVRKHTDNPWVILYIQRRLKAPFQMSDGTVKERSKGTPQGGVISPLLSNIYLTPFDDELTRRGYRRTRYCDDWVILCQTKEEAAKALQVAKEILSTMDLVVYPEKTRITHISSGFEFLGYKIKRGSGTKLPGNKIKKKFNPKNIYVFPTQKSINRFMDQIRSKTKRRTPRTLQEIVNEINPVIRGWGNYYRKAHVRKLFNRLRGWIIRRIWSHQKKRWRNDGWKQYPDKELYGRYGLVNLIRLIPDIGQKP